MTSCSSSSTPPDYERTNRRPQRVAPRDLNPSRYQFAATKTLAHPDCLVCEYQSICHGGCPKHRHDPRGNFHDLDYFCAAYKMIFAKAVGPLRKEVQRL